MLNRDGGQCVIAGPHCLGVATEPDHRANRGVGGSRVLDEPSAIVAACGICNGWKTTVYGSERDDLEHRGVIVLKAATNDKTAQRCRDTPVQYPDGRWFYLRDDGTREELTDDELEKHLGQR